MPRKKTALDLWLTGEKVPTPIVDVLIDRPALLERPYRTVFLTSMRKELAARRTPEALVGNLFMTIVSNIIPPVRGVAQTMTKETIRRRYGMGGEGEEGEE